MTGGDADRPADEILEKTAKALGLNALLPEAYDDLLQPSFRQLGQGLVVIAKAVNMALSPLAALVWSYEELRSWLHVELLKRLSRTSSEDIEPPRPHIAGPALLHLAFLENEAPLRELFANLLATELNVRKRQLVHPAYVSVLQQMSPDEARILRWLGDQEGPWYLSDCMKSGRTADPPLEERFRACCRAAEVVHPDFSDAYLDNLQRLRILVCDLHSTTEFARRAYFEEEQELVEGTVRELYVSSFGKGLIAAVRYDSTTPPGSMARE